MKKFKMAKTSSQKAFPRGMGGAKLSRSKAFSLLRPLKNFVCNLFKGEPSRVNSEQSRQFTHNSSLSTVHSHAFTLAETLIVMGIIGVVAAFTIPNVNKNTGRAETVAKVKKIYAELNEAHNRATAVYGPIKTWSSFSATRYFDRISEFMKLQKNCRDTGGCMRSSQHDLNGELLTSYPALRQMYTPQALLANGSSFCIINWSPRINCNQNAYTGYHNNYCGLIIYVDIDGPKKGKNTWGIDLCIFDVLKDGIEPWGGGHWWEDSYMSSTGSMDSWPDCFGHGVKCAAWVIKTGNMDYLDADNTGKCKHSNKTLSVDNNVFSCK